jgi:glutamyl-tRNA synthetase
VGGARTALFNWLFARHDGGVFILRIEDTDRSRSTEEFIQSILEAMRWLGLDWDGEPYRQTDRFEIYKSYAERLLAEGKAYRCFCPSDELEAKRKAAQARGETYRYDGRCRDRADQPSGPYTLRLRIPQDGRTVVRDLIHGEVAFEHAQLDDWILVRSAGVPTYNFCVVVDDVTMKISHVIRGNDHLSNTPKQLLLYQALGEATPAFAHIPMILGADRGRLSKRHGATSVLAFRDQGILPDAMVNYLARLGWSHGDQEIFTREELIRYFSLEQVGVTGAIFDASKLEWLSGHWLRELPLSEVAEQALLFLERAGLPRPVDQAWFEGVVASLRERATTLVELVERARFYFEPPREYDPAGLAKFLTTDSRPRLERLLRRLEALDSWDEPAIEGVYRQLALELGLKLVDLAQPTRLALTGKTASPPIFHVMALLGREATMARLRAALEAIPP